MINDIIKEKINYDARKVIDSFVLIRDNKKWDTLYQLIVQPGFLGTTIFSYPIHKETHERIGFSFKLEKLFFFQCTGKIYFNHLKNKYNKKIVPGE
jgi:hypothetical protein